MLTLYYRPTCPFCQKVISTSDEMGVAFNLKDISDEANAAELMEKGGKQQVPFLDDPEQEVQMYESDDIIAYVKENYAEEEAASDGKPKVHVAGGTCVSCEG